MTIVQGNKPKTVRFISSKFWYSYVIGSTTRFAAMMLRRTPTAARRSGLGLRWSVMESVPAVSVPGPRLGSGDRSSEWRQEAQVLGTLDIFEPKITLHWTLQQLGDARTPRVQRAPSLWRAASSQHARMDSGIEDQQCKYLQELDTHDLEDCFNSSQYNPRGVYFLPDLYIYHHRRH